MVRFNTAFLKAFIRISILLSLLTFTCMTPTQAAVKLTVNKTADTNDGDCSLLDCSLREAIADATSGSTIVFTSALSGQTITLGSTLVLDKNLTIDASSLSSHIKISGNNNDNVFTIEPGMSVSLDHVWILNGDALVSGGGIVHNGDLLQINNSILSSNNAIVYGGAIYNNGVLEISNSQFNNNHSSAYGGAIYNTDSGSITISASDFTSNYTEQKGGAIYNAEGVVTIASGSAFSSNYVSSTSDGDGGAIANIDGVLNISATTFNSNTAAHSGGAVYSSGGTHDITSSTFSYNTATNLAGGAILNMTSNATFTHSTFMGNSAKTTGGGIFLSGYQAEVENCTFSGNTADYGGGIGIPTTMVYVRNNTLSANTARVNLRGGAIDSDNSSILVFSNNIFANSTNDVDCLNLGSMQVDAHNLIESNSENYPCGTPVSSEDPILAPLADYGGSTLTFDLLPGSPALDSGHDATCTASDQRGLPRPIGPHCDIGSVENGVAIFLPVIYR
jgi:CSLREA domain-containing protein